MKKMIDNNWPFVLIIIICLYVMASNWSRPRGEIYNHNDEVYSAVINGAPIKIPPHHVARWYNTEIKIEPIQ